MGKKKMLMRKFGSVAIVNNTFIGGVASTINTPALLADKLGIDVNRIENFNINGVNIDAYVDGNYVLPSNFMGDVSSLTYFKDLDGLVTSNVGKMFLRCFNLEEVYLPNMVAINGVVSNWTFENTYGSYTKWKIFYIPNVINFGTTVGNDINVFRTNFSNSIKIYTHPSMQTINSGGVEGDLALFDSLGSNSVEYVQNFTKPNPVTDLSVNTVYATSISLDWSIPSSTNAIDYYEVYVDGVFYKNTSTNEIIVTGLTNLQTYNFSVIAVDIFYNKSEMSNVVTQQINGVDPVFSDPSSIISYYKFENNVLDSIGNNDGIATDITYASGQVGNAAVFNGGTSYVQISDNDSLSFTNGANDLEFSISFVVKLDILTATSRVWIYGKRTSGVLFEYQFSIYDGTCYFDIYDSVNNAYIRNRFNYTLFNTSDYFTVINTYNGLGLNGMETYINGVLVPTTRTAIGVYERMRNTTSPLILGKREGAGSFIDGKFDDTSIFNKALSQSEVTEITNLHNAGFPLI